MSNQTTTLITCKELAEQIQVSHRTAQRIFKEIKEEYNVKRVLKIHVIKYLSL